MRGNLVRALGLDAGTDHLSPEAIGMLELSNVRAHAMASFLNTFEDTYNGGTHGYLTDRLGFPDDDVERMRQNLAAAPV